VQVYVTINNQNGINWIFS